MESDVNAVPETNIEEILARYPVVLFDAYGVLVHADGPLPGAAALISELNRSNRPYYILTNDASQLPETAARRYRAYGLAIEPGRIITPGELLPGYFADRRLTGARCVVLGPADTARYVERAGGRPVAPDRPFDALVLGDLNGFPFRETVDTVLTALLSKLDRQEPAHLILLNPDLIYPDADGRFGVASGSLALILEAALQLRHPDRAEGRFLRLGKPNSPLFAEALRRAGTRDMVMLGDQLETDIRGANDFGIDSVLMTTGVLVSAKVSESQSPRPTYLLRSLAPFR